MSKYIKLLLTSEQANELLPEVERIIVGMSLEPIREEINRQSYNHWRQIYQKLHKVIQKEEQNEV